MFVHCRYVLPFSEVLDWSEASLEVDERQFLQLPFLLRGISPSQLLRLRLHTQFMWDTYFSSVSKTVLTTLEVSSEQVQIICSQFEFFLLFSDNP